MRKKWMLLLIVIAGALLIAACSEDTPTTSSGTRTQLSAAATTSTEVAKSAAAPEETPNLDAAIFRTKSASHHFRIARAEDTSPAMHVEGEISRSGTDHRMHYTVTGAPTPEDNGEWITMESKIYHKSVAAKEWAEINNAAARSLIESAIFDKQEDLDEATHVGTEKLNGVETHRFTRNGKFATNPAKYEFWTDQENVLKCEVKADNKVTYTTTFDKFGTVSEIKKPM